MYCKQSAPSPDPRLLRRSYGRHRDLPAHCSGACAAIVASLYRDVGVVTRRRRPATLCNRRAHSVPPVLRGFAHGRFPYAGPCPHAQPAMAGARKPSPCWSLSRSGSFLESGHKRRRCSSRQSWVGSGTRRPEGQGRYLARDNLLPYHGCHNKTEWLAEQGDGTAWVASP